MIDFAEALGNFVFLDKRAAFQYVGENWLKNRETVEEEDMRNPRMTIVLGIVLSGFGVWGCEKDEMGQHREKKLAYTACEKADECKSGVCKDVAGVTRCMEVCSVAGSMCGDLDVCVKLDDLDGKLYCWPYCHPNFDLNCYYRYAGDPEELTACTENEPKRCGMPDLMPCSFNAQCVSGLCAEVQAGEKWCMTECAQEGQTAGCPKQEVCTAVGAKRYCWPMCEEAALEGDPPDPTNCEGRAIDLVGCTPDLRCANSDLTECVMDSQCASGKCLSVVGETNWCMTTCQEKDRKTGCPEQEICTAVDTALYCWPMCKVAEKAGDPPDEANCKDRALPLEGCIANLRCGASPDLTECTLAGQCASNKCVFMFNKTGDDGPVPVKWCMAECPQKDQPTGCPEGELCTAVDSEINTLMCWPQCEIPAGELWPQPDLKSCSDRAVPLTTCRTEDDHRCGNTADEACHFDAECISNTCTAGKCAE